MPQPAARRIPRRLGPVLRQGDQPLMPFMLAAFCMLPFLRRPLGKNAVRPKTVIQLTLLLVLLPPIAQFVWYGFQSKVPPPSGHLALCYFAIVYAVVASSISVRRWWGLRHGEEIHASETGESWLATRLPVNPVLTEQLIVPLAVGLVGYAVKLTVSAELGLWLMWCGLSLFALARWEQKCFWAAYQRMVNDRVHAEHYGNVSDAHDARQAAFRR